VHDESVGREHHPLEEEDRSQQDASACQPLCKAATADYSGELRGQRYGQRHNKRREYPKSPDEIAEYCVRPGRKQRHDWRLIDIPPIGPIVADDEVEFITKETVMPVGQSMQRQACQAKDQRRIQASSTLVSSHPSESLVAVPQFAQSLRLEFSRQAEDVEL
jgi:hypothetical protein